MVFTFKWERRDFQFVSLIKKKHLSLYLRDKWDVQQSKLQSDFISNGFMLTHATTHRHINSRVHRYFFFIDTLPDQVSEPQRDGRSVFTKSPTEITKVITVAANSHLYTDFKMFLLLKDLYGNFRITPLSFGHISV